MLLAVVAIGYGTFLHVTSSYKFVRKDAEFFNQSYAYGLDQMKKACEGMSRWSYFAGPSDGAVQVPIPHGKTYYYKSRCYLELARKEMSEELCSKAKKRWSLLYDGSGVSKEACVKEVRRLVEMDRGQQQSNRDSQAIKAQAIKIDAIAVDRVAAGKWSLRLKMTGQLAGDYKLEFMNGAAAFSDPNRIFRSEEITLAKGPTTITRFVERTQLITCKGCELYPKRVYPIAASLTLLRTSDSVNIKYPLLINVVNTSIGTD